MTEMPDHLNAGQKYWVNKQALREGSLHYHPQIRRNMVSLSPFRSITRRFVAATSKYTRASPRILLGPPEIHPLLSPAPFENHLLLVPSGKPRSPRSPFIDAVTALFNNFNFNFNNLEEAVPKPKPPMWLMEKPFPTFQSSGNPCLDFFNMVECTPPETVRELLRRAWAHNPLTTLKIILRRRFDYYSNKKVFYTVVFWLHQNHPKTLAMNVRWFAQVGCMPYLVDILFREVAHPHALKIAKEKIRLLKKLDYPRRAKKERLRPDLARGFVERYTSDSNYRFLYDMISDFLAESLKSEIGFLNSGEFWKIGSTTMWVPSLDSPLDCSTLLCESIAKRVFPRESDPSYAQMEEAHYSYIVRERLRDEILHPLIRINLRLPRLFHDIPERVPVILSFLQGNNMDEVKELQWKRMVEDLSKRGKLSNCLSVCDVSGSMDGTPMEVCVTLGLLVSELSEDPWRGNVINFSLNPQLHRIQGETLREKLEFIKSMEWGMNIDFLKVFDRILDVAVASKLEEEKMVKRVFVFTDMGFCEALENSWESDYDTIHRKYEEKGYGSSVPEIVLWTLCDFSEFIMRPAVGREKGVLQVHGLSMNLLNSFLDNGGLVNVEEVMEEAIAREEHQRVSVFD